MAFYIRLRRKTLERLIESAAQEMRRPRDQAAYMLEQALEVEPSREEPASPVLNNPETGD